MSGNILSFRDGVAGNRCVFIMVIGLLCAMTIASIEKIFTEELTSLYGVEEASGIAWLVIGTLCKIDRSRYLNMKHDTLDPNILSRFQSILKELKDGVPVQYVFGETQFYGLTFKVNGSVLIPRPETEELVDWIIKDSVTLKAGSGQLSILDIGTGSGCIPVTLKRFLSESIIHAMDVSVSALEVARENARSNQAEISFIEDNILFPVTKSHFDIIVSNPPYITMLEKEQMHNNVLDHEPHLALFVPNEDPLLFYEAIADFAYQNLNRPGSIYLEINERFGVETISMLVKKGFQNLELREDISGKPRMVKGQLN